MKFIATLLLLCAMAGFALVSGSSWSEDPTTTTTEYHYYDPSSTTVGSATTIRPKPPCGGDIQGPCGKLGAKKMYFFY